MQPEILIESTSNQKLMNLPMGDINNKINVAVNITDLLGDTTIYFINKIIQISLPLELVCSKPFFKINKIINCEIASIKSNSKTISIYFGDSTSTKIFLFDSNLIAKIDKIYETAGILSILLILYKTKTNFFNRFIYNICLFR